MGTYHHSPQGGFKYEPSILKEGAQCPEHNPAFILILQLLPSTETPEANTIKEDSFSLPLPVIFFPQEQ